MMPCGWRAPAPPRLAMSPGARPEGKFQRWTCQGAQERASPFLLEQQPAPALQFPPGFVEQAVGRKHGLPHRPVLTEKDGGLGGEVILHWVTLSLWSLQPS